jgi:opacity protein-like surface antigen
MIKTIKLAALGLFAATAVQAADLPKRTPPLPPIPDRVALEPQFYAGAFVGGVATDFSSWSGDARIGAVAGWQPFKYARVEGVYEYGWNGDNARHSNSLVANAIGQYPIGNFTPYALVGTGYRWSTNNEAIWNVGAGVRYSITRNIETDLRYRYVADYNVNNHQNVITIGLNYRF